MHSTRDDIVHGKEEIDVNKIFWRAICLKIFYDKKSNVPATGSKFPCCNIEHTYEHITI